MTHSVGILQKSQPSQGHLSGGLAQLALAQGIMGGLACKCSVKNNIDFLIKTDRIVCASCGREVLCQPPLLGIYIATCGCCWSSSIKSTFVLDSRGIYVCTWCNQTR